jgi:hypothetical protein
MLLTIALFAVALLAYYGWRRHYSNTASAAYIATYGFPLKLQEQLLERYPQLTQAQLQQVIKGLREYLQISRMGRRQLIAMPSQAVDVAWHAFILHTRLYQHFCQKAFGHFLHHTPSSAMRSPTDAQAGIKRAWRLACAREQINPKQPQRLPLLFALDAELGIADGLYYQLNCRAGNPAGTTDGYCASHIGCSSGCAGSSSSSDSGSSDGGDGGCSGD